MTQWFSNFALPGKFQVGFRGLGACGGGKVRATEAGDVDWQGRERMGDALSGQGLPCPSPSVLLNQRRTALFCIEGPTQAFIWKDISAIKCNENLPKTSSLTWHIGHRYLMYSLFWNPNKIVLKEERWYKIYMEEENGKGDNSTQESLKKIWKIKCRWAKGPWLNCFSLAAPVGVAGRGSGALAPHNHRHGTSGVSEGRGVG